MRTVIWFIYFWLYLVLLLPEYWKVQKLEREGKTQQHDERTRHDVAKWANRLLWLAGAKVTTTGRENIPQGPVVFVANHQSYFDIPLMITQLDKPNPLIAKKEIKKIPLIRSWMTHLRCVFIDRNDPRQSMESLKQAQELIRQGYSVVIFPEGTRGNGVELGEFKAGAIRMATRTGVPIVPVCIRGSSDMMPKGSLWIHPAKVQMKILPPVSTEGMSREQIRALPEELRSAVANELSTMK